MLNKMNFKKANIIITTLFVTLIIGLIWLLVTKYIINLIKISAENHKYYKSYYIAYAWIELELLKLKNHGFWFEDIISGDSLTVKNNFTWINHYFSSKIYSLSKNITNNPLSLISDIDCSQEENYILINTGDAILLPLFYDKNTWEWKLTWTNYEALNVDLNNVSLKYSWDFVVSIQKDYESQNYKKRIGWNWTIILSSVGISSIMQPWYYLIVGALEKWKFCIQSDNKLVNMYSYIQSWGSYMDRKVLLNVVKKNKWANFTVYGIY